MRELNREFWSQLLAQLNDPSVGVVAKALADAHNLEVGTACDSVEDAIDEGILVEEDTGGAFDVVRLPEEDDPDNETVESPETGDIEPREGRPDADTPKGKTVKTPEEKAVDALRDVLRFYNARVDDTIDDHTEEGDHPERPTTAREYFTEGRGWDDDTVDDLLLGWAPPDHSDELVAYLHDRGHDREAILATGAVGKTDSGGFYTTFQGRYVLPYYDADGEPAYAIARVTGGDGGGAKGYGGHPSDYQAGKYAKLRHTDDRVPFDEPIYGLDTLDEGAHVVVAEGIADAITARELGYSVLSPVAKEFKEAHYGPLADALDDHGVGRMTIVADADGIRNDDTDEDDPETIGDAVSRALSPVGAGLAGSLRTATKLGDRTEADIRVTVPPAPAALENDLDEFVNGPWNGDLDALLASAKPADAFAELDEVVSNGSAAGFDEFDPEEYEPTATSAEETTDDIRDVYAALDRLDAQRVAERTIVSEWLEGRSKHRTFAPTWAPADYTGTANYVDGDKWVDTGGRGGYGGPAVMAAIDAGLVRDTNCPDAVTGETWIKAVDHLRDLGFSIPELERSEDSGRRREEDDRDLLGLDVVVEPGDAMRAARAVTPDDLDRPLPELERDDVDDVAIAVALADGVIDSPDVFPRDDGYTEAYYRVRDVFGAPLPKYLDNSTLTERFDLVKAALDRVGPEHILDELRSTITVEDPPSQAIAKIDPTWEESESGERIVAGYGSGFWCAEHGVSFTPLQLVALEHGIIDDEGDYPTGEGYKRAYRLLREEYGAPIPRWRANVFEEVGVLPPTVRVVDDDLSARDTFSLDEARKQTEELVRDALTMRDRAQLVTVFPGGGKTFSTAIVADDEPVLYVPPRNELKKQMEDYGREICESDEFDAEPTTYHLPILAENRVPETGINAGVAAIRNGEVTLQDREALREIVESQLEDVEEGSEGEKDDEDTVDLNRATCATGEGEHGEAWRITVQVAHALGFDPATIHRNARTLFGGEIPCQHDGACEYTEGWDVIRDPGTCPDILIGSPGHAYVDSATSYYREDDSGHRVTDPRAVVVDEFPSDTYATDYCEEYMDHAVWLAEALVGVDNREDLLAAGLNTDSWVSLWLRGEADEHVAAGEAIDALRAGAELVGAVEAAEDLLDHDPIDLASGATSANLRGVVDALETLTEGGLGAADLEAVTDTVGAATEVIIGDADGMYADGREEAGSLYTLADTLREDILQPIDAVVEEIGDEPLADAIDERTAGLPIAGGLRQLVDDAVAAAEDDAPSELIHAAADALKGGRDGCRALAVSADGGYAHPDAWALLAGAIADPDDDGVSVGSQRTLSLGDGGEGIQHKNLTVNGADIHVDRDHHGAVVFDRPRFTDRDGGKCPLVGLDATARPDLWRIALGRDAEVRDIHDTVEERRRHIREGMKHTVVQTADTPLPYHGDPSGRNFQEDLAVVRAAGEEYTGPGGLDDKDPAVISTKKVLNHLGEELDELADETVNYENMKGSDALGSNQVLVILGSQHYGDIEPERWAMYAGESADRGETSGETLDYGSDVANTYLKHMREDHTMQAILRAGRNNDRSVVVAHTSALREDLPVVAEGATVSAHSKGALAVAEAAADLNDRSFTAADVADRICDDHRGVGLRQVQNILLDFRSSGYLKVESEGSRGREYEYGIDEEPGLADVDLPEASDVADGEVKTKSELLDTYSWNFVLDGEADSGQGMLLPATPTIPAVDTMKTLVEGDPPG